MSTLKAAFFAKNLPGWERVLRIAVAVAGVLVSLVLLPVPWSWLMASSALGFGGRAQIAKSNALLSAALLFPINDDGLKPGQTPVVGLE